ncbi:hypothetical protein NFI96_010462 [Prochilodus magdalenae]|nr:hypothetical protein NFI96_010462 [Prochilodus magdalenae]
MLGTLRVARLLKLTALPGPVTSPVCCHASHDARAWMGSAGKHSTAANRRRSREDVSEEELDVDAVEAKLESLVREQSRLKKAAKFHKIRRQMSERGAPERRLSWDAIEQIRYLKQESPQEWTVQKLADSFSVSPDVISRILRSKFTPTPERKIEQDSKVLATVRQVSFGDQSVRPKKELPMPNSPVPAISSGHVDALTPLSSDALAPIEFEKRLVPSGGDVALQSRGSSQISTAPATPQSTVQEETSEKQEAKSLEREEEQNWDRVFLTEEELEELVQTMHEKPSAVKQMGREFFDSEGNFLYRI